MSETYPIERDQILVPTNSGYRTYPLLILLGANGGSLYARKGFGLGTLRFLTGSSPYQHGVSVQGMRWNPKVLQILIRNTQESLTSYWEQRQDMLELLRPTRSFITQDKLVDPFIYRKWLPGGKTVHGSDMVTTNGDNSVHSIEGAFMHKGGLDAGHAIYINDVKYQILSAQNDAELLLTVPYAGATDTNVNFRYSQVDRYRDINFILEKGLTFDEGVGKRLVPHGFEEALRLRCHDPFWRGRTQEQVWELPAVFGDLVFDNDGAWFGVEQVSGRWVFNPEYINETVGVVYRGHDVARPLIYIAGPAQNPSITNITTDTTLSLRYEVQEGEQVIMDIDRLSVTNNFGDNLLGFLRGPLSTFGLVPEPAAPRGVNLISVTFGNASLASSARLQWRNVYAGI